MKSKQTTTEFYTVLSAGDLEVHETFMLRKNGRYYTVHDKVKTNEAECPETSNMFYVVAVCDGKMYVFDYDQNVIACR